MRAATDRERDLLIRIARGTRGSLALFELTGTQLQKSIIDATSAVKQSFSETGFHDFATQQPGPEGKTARRARCLDRGAVVDADLTLYLVNNPRHDPRFWISGLGTAFGSTWEPGDLILVAQDGTNVLVLDLSQNADNGEVDIPELKQVLGSSTDLVWSPALEQAGVNEADWRVEIDHRRQSLSWRQPGALPEGQVLLPAQSDGNTESGVGAMVTDPARGGGDWSLLWGQATGGRNVAEHLGGAVSAGPSAPPAPGVDEAVAWFKAGLVAGTPPRMLFLVGGPGAGKSHTASSVRANLEEIDGRDDGLAHRSYRYRTEGQDLLIVNDATITSRRHVAGALAGDIEDSIEKEWHLLACINRGVIVEEMSRHGLAESNEVGRIISWLHDGNTDRAGASDLVHELPTDKKYIRSTRVRLADGRRVDLLCVLMDSCSLMERRPEVKVTQGDGGVEIADAQEYTVSPFGSRGGLRDAEVPAAVLFEQALGYVPDLETLGPLGWNPVAANLASMKVPEVRRSVLSLLRASEIVSAKRFTYRELWGAIVRCLVGDSTERVSDSNFEGSIRELQASNDRPTEQFKALRHLAGLRFSQALFGAAEPDWAGNPVCRLTRPVDPCRDATPGRLSPNPLEGWATPIIDALAGGDQVDSPLKALLRDLKSAGDVFALVVTEFDWNLDDHFVAAKNSVGIKDRERDEMVAWYGTYLLRLYASANGIPAFRHEIEQWSLIWFSRPNLPPDLRGPMATLLLPRRNPDDSQSSYLLPLFDSRTVPIQGSVPEARLAIRGDSVEVSAEIVGDAVQVVLKKNGREAARIECDFPLVREALSCSEGHLGITEFTHSASPRLERLRASQLVPIMLDRADLCVVHGDSEAIVRVGSN